MILLKKTLDYMERAKTMNIAVIFAGGTGQRMKCTKLPKQFLEMHGKPIIIYTLEKFEFNDNIDAIVIACVKEWIEYLEKLVNRFHISKVKKIVPGGETGQMSIYNGLIAAKEVSVENRSNGESGDIVLIHDGVRPMIDDETIIANIESVKKYGSAITSAKVTETIMVVEEDGAIKTIPDRNKSRVAKAPQSFWLDEIIESHVNAQKEGIVNAIDSCTLMRQYKDDLHWIDGPYNNIKITTADDFYILRALMDAKENEQIYVEKQ